jgi:hypothetical protein
MNRPFDKTAVADGGAWSAIWPVWRWVGRLRDRRRALAKSGLR